MAEPTPTPAAPEPITLYGHNACPMLVPVRAMLDQAGASYTYVNIREDVAARQRVREINNGNESVPTLEFPDGSTLTEPSTGQLKRKLEAMGYEIPISAMLAGNLLWIVVVIMVLIALLRLFGVF